MPKTLLCAASARHTYSFILISSETIPTLETFNYSLVINVSRSANYGVDSQAQNMEIIIPGDGSETSEKRSLQNFVSIYGTCVLSKVANA